MQHRDMKQNILLLLMLFAGSSFARLEWPGKIEEGGFCSSEHQGGFQCQEGLACDRGICRKPCHDDSDCARNQRCDKDEYVGFCFEFC